MIQIKWDFLKKVVFDKSLNFERLPNRIRTRFIAVLALVFSLFTFGSGLLVFLYMKSPNFENQLLGQVMKHLEPIINFEIDKKLEQRNF